MMIVWLPLPLMMKRGPWYGWMAPSRSETLINSRSAGEVDCCSEMRFAPSFVVGIGMAFLFGRGLGWRDLSPFFFF